MITEARRIKSRASAAAWRARNPEKSRAYTAAWRLRNLQYTRDTAKAYYHSHRKDCLRKNKEWQKQNPEHMKAYRRRNGWRIHLHASYRITPEQYDAMLVSQNWLCPICRRDMRSLGRKRINVDHDHKTGKIRAVLCKVCNTALGHFKEDAAILQRALDYLNEHSPSFETFSLASYASR